jgi:hypothetical protein
MLRKMLLVGAMFSLLAGCGGGGSGGVADPAANLPAAYTGNKAPATVTAANAKALSVDVYNFSQDASSLNVLGKAVAGNGAQSPLLLQAVSTLEDTVSKSAASSKSESKVVAATATVQNAIPGYSGSCTYSISVDISSGSTSGTFTFSQFQADSTSVAMNGTVTFSGVFNSSTDTFSSFSMGMTGMVVTDGSTSITLSGQLTASVSGSTKTTTMTLAITDTISNRTVVLKDYTLQLYNNSSLTVTGTYFDPVNGYVVISTLTPLSVSDLSVSPTAGRLLFTGSNGTKARLTFTSSGYIVDVDTVGNGTFILVP